MSPPKAEELYLAQVSYFERPIISNLPYKYEALYVGSPYDFYLQIADSTTDANEAKLGSLLQGHLEELKGKGNEGEDKDILPPKLTNDLFYEGMPVLVKMKDKEGLKTEELARGEVIKIKDDERQVVDVLLVDVGSVLENLKWECDLLPMTKEILRVPKMGISCTLGMISPEGGEAWQTARDWEKDFLGKESQIVTFLDYYPDTKSYEAAVEVDKRNVAVKYFHEGVAQPLPLADFQGEGGVVAGKFPVADYSSWVGLKVIAYGLKVFRDEKDGNKLKCAVQIQPDIVNDVQTKVETFLKTASAEVKGQPFDKKVGSFCLAKFGEEYFRSTILEKQGDKYLVQYVDYKEEQLVGADEMIKLPESLQTMQEGAVICQITDLMSSDYQDIDKLKELLENQDLYAVVDACDAAIFGTELLVSLFQPTPEFNGTDTPLADLIKLPESERPPLVREILQTMELIPKEWDTVFMEPPLLIPNQVYNFKVMSTGDTSNPWDSTLVFCTDEKEGGGEKGKESEITWFYENGGCDPELKEVFMQGSATGTWVAAQITEELEEGEIRETVSQGGWLRAKVNQDMGDGGKINIYFVDFGVSGWAEKKEVFPLHKYFCKDPFKIVCLERKETGKIFN